MFVRWRGIKLMSGRCSSPFRNPKSGYKSKMTKPYQEAVRTLNSLQSNAETIEKKRTSPQKNINLKRMENFLTRTGLQVSDLDKLNIIHISGTKGKGSTAAFCESLLRHHNYTTGFFSSPHLVEVRERFRINSQPISKEFFSQKFWEVYNKLYETKEANNGDMPAYFAFLTVLGFHIFLHAKVDVTILEVGIGGEYDSTNVIRNPVVCGVTSLGLDHTSLLGNTIESIAWNKAGIFKPGIPAISVEQPHEAMTVLKQRADEKKCPLYITSVGHPIPQLELGITGYMQICNALLALQLTKVWLKWKQGSKCAEVKTSGSYDDVPALAYEEPTPLEKLGLASCRWYGRNQLIHRPGITYYLDGAHTLESMQQCVKWFTEVSDREQKMVKGETLKILLFNMTGDRDTKTLLTLLKKCSFHHALFSPNLTYSSIDPNHSDNVNKTVSDEYKFKRCHINKELWDQVIISQSSDTGENVGKTETLTNGHTDLKNTLDSKIFPCISSALFWASQGKDSNISLDMMNNSIDFPKIDHKYQHIQILITGSLHLVGGALELLMPDINCELK